MNPWRIENPPNRMGWRQNIEFELASLMLSPGKSLHTGDLFVTLRGPGVSTVFAVSGSISLQANPGVLYVD
jgi:hypothetical protein